MYFLNWIWRNKNFHWFQYSGIIKATSRTHWSHCSLRHITTTRFPFLIHYCSITLVSNLKWRWFWISSTVLNIFLNTIICQNTRGVLVKLHWVCLSGTFILFKEEFLKVDLRFIVWLQVFESMENMWKILKNFDHFWFSKSLFFSSTCFCIF